MSTFLPISPETDISMGSLYVRHDLVSQCVTIYLKPWYLWDLDTQQVEIAPGIYYFVEPNGDLTGVKSLTTSHTARVGVTP